MKKKILGLLGVFLAIWVSLPQGVFAASFQIDFDTACAAIQLVNLDTGTVVYEKNPDERREPASTTKIMTYIVVYENVADPDNTKVTIAEKIRDELLGTGSSLSGIQVGDVLSVTRLLHCMMIPSGNDAALALADFVGGGDVQKFVDMMNEKAEELGCTGTHFANTHGLPDENHYTTAHDIALIYREAISHDLFAEISGTVSYSVAPTNVSDVRELSNTNSLINQNATFYPGYYYEYAKDGKTGHTSAAGYCLVSSAEKNGVHVIAAVLGGQANDNGSGGYNYTNFADSITLYNWAFENFSSREILSSSELITEVNVAMAADDGKATLRPNTVLTAVVANDFDVSSLKRDIVIYSERDGETLEAPIAAGTVLGEITLSLDGDVYGTTQLIAGSSVELSKTQYMKNQIAEVLGMTWVKIVIVALVLALICYIALVVRYRVLHKRHMRELRRAKLERQRRMAEAAAQEPARSAPERPRETVHAAAPSRPRPQQPSQQQRPAQDAVQPDEAKRLAQEKARRDYFEEFFKNKQD